MSIQRSPESTPGSLETFDELWGASVGWGVFVGGGVGVIEGVNVAVGVGVWVGVGDGVKVGVGVNVGVGVGVRVALSRSTCASAMASWPPKEIENVGVANQAATPIIIESKINVQGMSAGLLRASAPGLIFWEMIFRESVWGFGSCRQRSIAQCIPRRA